MNSPTEVAVLPGCTILSFLPRPSGTSVNTPDFRPHSIRRDSDGQVFTIGDTIGLLNDEKIIAQIKGFGMLNDHVFIDHTWSGVGFGLEMLEIIHRIPGAHQWGDLVRLELGAREVEEKLNVKISDRNCYVDGSICGVHVLRSKIKYDIQVTVQGITTRLYNVDAMLLKTLGTDLGGVRS